MAPPSVAVQTNVPPHEVRCFYLGFLYKLCEMALSSVAVQAMRTAARSAVLFGLAFYNPSGKAPPSVAVQTNVPPHEVRCFHLGFLQALRDGIIFGGGTGNAYRRTKCGASMLASYKLSEMAPPSGAVLTIVPPHEVRYVLV
jgi:hypothetical protein